MSAEQRDVDDLIAFDDGANALFFSKVVGMSSKFFGTGKQVMSPREAEIIRRAAALIQAVVTGKFRDES